MSRELRAATAVWAERQDARTRGDLLYLVYLVLLTALVLVVPALRAAGGVLARPDVLPLLHDERAPRLLVLAVVAAAAGLVLLGGTRGPALLPPFLVSTLAASGIPRRLALRRPLLRALLVPVLLAVLGVGLIGATLLPGGGTDLAVLARAVLAAIGTGLLLGVCWLAGQLLGARGRALLAALLLAGGAAATALLGPRSAAPALPVALLLLAAGALATLVSLRLLDRVRGAVLREQAQRWQGAALGAGTGDLAGAAVAYRPPPTAGRRLRAIGRGGAIRAHVRRDAVGWLRSPARSLGGLALLLGGTGLLVLGPLLDLGLPSWVMVGVGILLLWAGSGTIVDGVQHAIHTLGAPRLFGLGLGRSILLHLPAPAALLLVATAAGAGTVELADGGAPGVSVLGPVMPAPAALTPVLLVPVLLAGRVWHAAKGPLPLALTVPMPTPQGDFSVIAQLAWQADAPLLLLGIGVVLVLLASVLGGTAALVGAVAATGLLVLLAHGRLRELRR